MLLRNRDKKGIFRHHKNARQDAIIHNVKPKKHA